MPRRWNCKTIYSFGLMALFGILPAGNAYAIPPFQITTYTADWNDYHLTGTLIRKSITGHMYLQMKPMVFQDVLYDLAKHRTLPMDANGKDTKVSIPVVRNGILPYPDIREHLTIEFDILPSTQRSDAILLSKTIYRGGLEYGIRLSLHHRTLILDLHRFLESQTGERFSAKIQSQVQLTPRDQNRISLQFRANEPNVWIFVNGREAGQLTDKEVSQAVAMGFHPDDKTDLVYGEDLYGKTYQFKIFRGLVAPVAIGSQYPQVSYNPDTKIASQNFGTATSPVYKTQFSHSSLLEYDWNVHNPSQSVSEIWIRTSHLPFARDSKADLPRTEWLSLDDFVTKPKCGETQSESPNCFRYYQFRFLVRSDPNGFVTPEIHSFSAKIQESLPPKKVTGLSWDQKKSDLKQPKICLRWIGSDEPGVWKNGGYKIHYGFSPSVVEASLILKSPARSTELAPVETSNLANIEKSESKTKRVSLVETCLTNAILSQYSESFYPEKNLPFFQPGTTVYFKVSAYNGFWSETGSGKDQTSPLSSEISVTIPHRSPEF